MSFTDFHMHTILSDGFLLPSELVRRAEANGYTSIAITDHVDVSTIDRVIIELSKMLNESDMIDVIPGVEITHVLPSRIPELAKKAKQAGLLVIVHGETIVEPVRKGTNFAALNSGYVDILAHPGLITEEEVKLAVENDVFLELSGRKGHSFTNGHVARLAKKYNAKMLVNSDTHTPSDMLSQKRVSDLILGAGLKEKDIEVITQINASELRKRFIK
ncbi:MAG: histidinol phosphate phosphatase domain-containing protein [Candidatus Heimdallarchaeum endolithica]|uniref:Histidinol phosphate phosphatase domain-containing protein n=1 Tax=Candidatus Heimdallarchaeum endolithica TaxID=2876572 RepID=A0A9Y1FNE6_9ARCH|nr:MAG: histidinol phosphate phosphatase domain-containing protein [Candidatus Heimdallarchaeum endolithica]